MKISLKILHLPPYISTSWNHVRALYMKDSNLVVVLASDEAIQIPGLAPDQIDAIFHAHAAFLENQQPRSQERVIPIHLFQAPAAEGESSNAMRLSFDNKETFTSFMHHNPAQANIPDLPKEIVNKIAGIAKAIAPEDIQNMPKPEPHCNCIHCQVARAIHQFQPDEKSPLPQQQKEEEEVTEADLTFQTWEIAQTGDKLYSVSSRLDPSEKYSVFLGDPIGCTCGKHNCEHVIAVLKS